jgi:hypothetical protein
MTGNIFIYETDYFVYIVLSNVLWKINWYHKMYNVIGELSHKPRSL